MFSLLDVFVFLSSSYSGVGVSCSDSAGVSVIGTSVGVGSVAVGCVGSPVSDGTGVSGVAVGCSSVAVGSGGVGVAERVGLGVRVRLAVWVGLIVGGMVVGGGTVQVAVGPSERRTRVAVEVQADNKVEVGVSDGGGVYAARNVAVEGAVGVVVAPVTGRRIGVGMYSAIISNARAAAVLFMLAYEPSWVLRS